MTSICNETMRTAKNQTVYAILASTGRQLFAHLKAQIARRHRHNQRRLAFLQMLKLDDNILKDIGVSRDDVVWASKLSRDINAAQELNAIRERSRRAA